MFFFLKKAHGYSDPGDYNSASPKDPSRDWVSNQTGVTEEQVMH